MSRTVDERVVEMRFDNKQFEAGTKQTLGTLEKLKHALNFQDYGKSFDNLQKSANRVDMSGLGNAVESVKLKFSALEVAAITALSNIVNRAVDAGVRLAKSLSIDQITAGFGEYELKMGSVQTILASTGESLETVNKYLEELNRYSDKTIYSFSDMTQNIGKFTNAGVKLEDAVKAIQGVSNEAAVSGANANEASRAMYNFAQALSSGFVKLIDWKSIENANMATVEFKQQLIDTAVALGTVVKEGDKYQTTTTNAKGKISELFDATSAFNDSLNHQWMTTEVLVQTLGNYSTDVREMTDAEKEAYEEKLRGVGYTEEQIKAIEELGKKAFDSAQDVKTFSQLIDTMRESVGSGWAQTFELIFGDFEEAKKLWTNVNNVLGSIIQESSESRNELLRGWKEAGGRDALLGGISNSFNALLTIVKAVGEAFRSVFPKTTSDQLVGITKGFQNLTSKLIPSSTVLNNLKRTFTGLFSIVDIVGQAIGAFFKILVPGISTVGDMGEGILGVTASIGDWVTNLNKAIKENNVFAVSVEKIREVVENVLSKVREVAKNLFGLDDLSIRDGINNISSSFGNLSLEISNLNLKNLGESFDNLKMKIREFLGSPTSNEGLANFVTNFKAYGEELKNAFTLDSLLGRLEKVMDVFGKFFNWIKTTIGPVFDDFNVGSAVAGAGGLGLVYALIEMSKAFEKMSGTLGSIPRILGGVTDALEGVKGTLEAYQKDLKANALIKIAGAIAILAAALALLSLTDTKRLIEASIALSLVAGVLMLGASKLLEATNKGEKLNSALTIFSKGLSSAMKDFGKAIKIKAIGTAVKDFAASIAIIAASIIALGIMWDKNPTAFSAALKTVGGIAMVLVGIIGLISIASRLGDPKGMKSIGISILTITASLALIVIAINKLMKMELPSDYDVKLGILVGIIGGLAGLATLLGVAAKIAGGNQLPKMASTIKSLALLLIATVLSLKVLFDMELPLDYKAKLKILNDIFVGFGVLLLAMGAAAKIAGGNGFKAAGTILAMAGFLAVVVGSLFVLTIIPTDKMLKGAIGLGLVLVALGAALYGSGKVVDAEAAKAVIAMAATVGVIAASLAVLSMIPWKKLAVSAASLGVVLLTLSVNFQAISKIKVKEVLPIALAMVAATLSIAYSLYALSEQPWQNMLAASSALSLTLIALAGCFAILSKAKIDLMSIASVVAGSASLILIAAGISMLTKYDGQALLNSCLALSAMLAVMIGVMAACGALSVIIGPAMTGVLGLGAVIAELALVLAAIGALAQIPGLKWLIGEGGSLLQGVGEAIGSFIGGIIGGVMGGIAAQLPQIGTDLSNFMDELGGFIAGSKNIKPDTLAGVGILSGIIIELTKAEVINGIASLFGLSLSDVAIELSEFMKQLGPFIEYSKDIKEDSMRACGYLASMIITLTAAELLTGIGKILGLSGSLSEFGKELSEFGPHIKKFSEDVKDVNPEAVQGAAAAAEIMANMANKLPGTGGFVQKVFGEKSLAEFGNELVKFGPAIKKFAEEVKDVEPSAVQGASSAAEIMANMANKLPPQGGLVQKVFGERSLADFGEELVKFAPRISQFANQVKNVKPDAITGASTAATLMSELANNLPSSATLFDKIFGGGQVTLSQFGEELVKFGTSLSSFSVSVSGVNTEQVNAAISSFKSLVDLTTYMQGSSATVLVNFSNQLGKIGADSVDKFVQAFKDTSPKAITAVNGLLNTVASTIVTGGSTIQSSALTIGNNLCTGLQNGIISKQSTVISTENVLTTNMINTLRNNLPIATFSTIGQNAIQGLINGINAKKPLALSTVKNLCMAVINQFRISMPQSTFSTIGQNAIQGLINGINAKKPLVLSTIGNLCIAIINKFRTGLPSNTFKTFGENTIAWIIQGMESKKSEVGSSVAQICDSITQAFRDNLSQSDFKEIGANAALGIKYGIEDTIDEIADAAIEAAEEAVSSAKGALDERSPSRVMRKVGEFYSLGLAGGIIDQIRSISAAGTRAADEAIEPVKKAVDGIKAIIDSGDFNVDPVIRPVMDLSGVRNGAREIGSLMNRTYDLSPAYNRVMDVSSSFNTTKKARTGNDDISSRSGEGDKYEFNQYNYSPKALTRSEIYRQTNNQFSAFRRAVNPE